jgi:TMEM175 potassium channel family protein
MLPRPGGGAGSDGAPVGSRWDTGRTEAFSDGVFAFAITLLVLDIHVPASEFTHLWRAIADQWPSYLGYATSFLTVGGIWLVHHGIFRRVQYANRRVMTLNLVLLMAVAFLPFPTSLVAHAIRNTDAERAAVIFYGASLLVIALLYSALWATVAGERSLLKPDVSEKEVDAIARATTPNLGFYVAVILLAFIAPKVAAFGYLVIAIVALVRVRGDRAPTTTTPGSG